MPDDASTLGQEALTVEMAPRVNLGFFHNSIPVISQMRILNDTDSPWEDVVVSMRCEPPFFREKSWRVDRVGAHASHYIEKPSLDFDVGLMERLTERESTQIVWTLTCAAGLTGEWVRTVDCVARNHWCGSRFAPELLASYVRPNDPVVDGILARAADLLRAGARDPLIAGYNGKPERAWELASAIWQALRDLQLEYSKIPAGFESEGQKIREPGHIAEGRMVNCLDATLLLCSTCEQAGLHPLVVLTEGHAFAGVWLRPTQSPATVIQDAATLRNLVRIRQIILLESTYLTQRDGGDFQAAIVRGAEQVRESGDENFSLALDIAKSRDKGFAPFGSERSRVKATGGSVGSAVTGLPEVPLLELVDDADTREAPKTPEGRVAHWRRMLLDLSARNSLLNFNSRGKKSVPLLVVDSGKLEDILAADGKLRILPFPSVMSDGDARDAELFREKTGNDAALEYALRALEKNQVHAASLGSEEFDARLTELYRQARTDLQEGGANTLYLAFGFLVWRRSADPERRFRAPLVLVPVTLERRGVGGGFYLLAHEDESRFNSTLLELLRQDFELELPWLSEALPTDAHGIDIERVKREVAHAILGREGWEVVDDVVLSTFSFSKYLMWKDLSDRLDALKENAVVKHLIECPHERFPAKVQFPELKELDAESPPTKILCPVPADSSQLGAVAAAAAGKNFIIIGPPGTGKSQTITNIIANALADGKRVLFVAEKIAALEVVHRRLAAIGLGDFCLELHSGKARKSEVLKRLKAGWDTARTQEPADWKKEADRLYRLRTELNGFVEVMHRTRRNGLSVYGAMSTIAASSSAPPVAFAWDDAEVHDCDAYAELKVAVAGLDTALAELQSDWPHPLSFVTQQEVSSLWITRFVKQARSMIPLLAARATAAAHFGDASGIRAETLCRAPIGAVSGLIALLPRAYEKSWSFLLRPDGPVIVRRLESATGLLEQYRALKKSLPPPWPDATVRAALRGLELLARYEEQRARLSVKFLRESIESVDFIGTLEEWRVAQASLFRWVPLFSRAARLRSKIRSHCCLASDVPVLPRDLEALAAMRQLRLEMDALDADLTPLAGYWNGPSTDRSLVTACLAHRASLVAAMDDGEIALAVEDEASLSLGACGEKIRDEHAVLRQMRRLRAELAGYDDLTTVTEWLWQGLKTDMNEVRLAVGFSHELGKCLANLATDDAHLGEWRAAVTALLTDRNPCLAPGGSFVSTGAQFSLASAEFSDARVAWAADGAASMADASDEAVKLSVAACMSHEGELRAWCNWVAAAEKAKRIGLASFVDEVINQGFKPCELQKIFEVNYARWWVDLIEVSEPMLREFSVESHERKIDMFRKVDERFMLLTRDYIRARLSARVPVPGEESAKVDVSDVAMGTQWGALKREMVKKSQHKPLRELFESCAEPLSVLAPCLLMSPLSIAQYLAAGVAPFDIVVFDEASQIPTWDAVGAMARGRSVVMVGDPRQLPPTSFFKKSGQDAQEDDGNAADMESILDECCSAQLPQWPLIWHYRSRDESLITFSNRQYYGNRLITCPSPCTKDSAVSFRYVEDGVYGRGDTGTNPIEARALVDEIVSRLRSPGFSAMRQSIGVVTFNVKQRNLIENLLDAERIKYPEIEEYFQERDESGDQREYLFVKNLESVQGDERDIIYFSVTFGRDAAGVSPTNFGPIAKNGGQRRLNVAFSRARREMRVFASIKADQLNLRTSQQGGPSDLKLFLSFAEKGVAVLPAAENGSVGGFESPFEEAVANALRAKGWEVRTQIGVSVFRIDLAVVHPAMPGRFLAGIECDGASYHSSATARDRDKLREQVLRGLGWEIHRVWSTDWWHDAARCINKLDAKLRAQMEQLPLN